MFGRTVQQLVKISRDRLGIETHKNVLCVSKNVRTPNLNVSFSLNDSITLKMVEWKTQLYKEKAELI